MSERIADDEGWKRGTTVPVTFADGTTTEFTVGAVYENRDIAGNYVLSREAWTPHAVQDVDNTVLINLENGVALEDGRRAVERHGRGVQRARRRGPSAVRRLGRSSSWT